MVIDGSEILNFGEILLSSCFSTHVVNSSAAIAFGSGISQEHELIENTVRAKKHFMFQSFGQIVIVAGIVAVVEGDMKVVGIPILRGEAGIRSAVGETLSRKGDEPL